MKNKILFIITALSIISPAYGVSTLVARAVRMLRTMQVKKPSFAIRQKYAGSKMMPKPCAPSFAAKKSTYKLPTWFAKPLIKNQVKKAVFATAAVAATTVKRAQTQGKAPFVMPAFTAANIDHFNADSESRKAFIEHACSHINTADKKIIETIAHLLERYQEAGPKLMDAALKQFENNQGDAIHALMLKHIIYYSPDSAQDLIKALLNKPNSHLAKLIQQSFEPTEIEESTWVYDNNWRWKKITKTSPNLKYNPDYQWIHRSFIFKQAIATHLLDTLINNPGITSVAGYDHVHTICSKIPEEQRKDILKRLTKGALYHYGQDAKTMIGLAKKSIKLSDIVDKPQCVYADEIGRLTGWNWPKREHVADAVIREIDSVPLEDLEWTLESLGYYETTTKARLKKAAQNHYGDNKENPELAQLAQKDIISAHLQSLQNRPSFIDNKLWECTATNHTNSQTEKHFCANISNVLQQIFKTGASRTSNAISLFNRARTKEREELSKGNYVFYHGRQWGWDFIADVYKHAYNITKKDTDQVRDDFVFLRFDDSKRRSWNGDPLYMNAALFGNSQNSGSCTAQYVMGGYDMSGGFQNNFTPNTILTSFALEKYYAQYHNDFNHLKKLHTDANPQKYGSLLVVSIPANEVNKVQNTSRSGSAHGTKYLLDSRTIKDHYEFTLPLDKDYALDPKKGPRIYSMNACDPAKYKEYTDYRDQLFAKIKSDMNGGKV